VCEKLSLDSHADSESDLSDEKLVCVCLFLETSYVMITIKCIIVSASSGHFEKQIVQNRE
jgi:hypothetical protein